MNLRLAHGVMAALVPFSSALQPQPNTSSSSFALSPSQMRSANLSADGAGRITAAARFERSNWASGSVRADPFYTSLPPGAGAAPPGAVLKVEAAANTSRYTVPPALALSRLVYQSRALDGSRVPVSAYVLWPYRPRGAGPAPLVSWGHGASGTFAECAPSHIRNLWYQFSAPYALALAGYAVVGSDYAGLGVPVGPGGAPITHQFLASPAAGNDLLYGAQAAQAAFPGALTEHFVVMGHSQGGGAAWAAAQQQLEARVPGYLGAVVAAPATNAIDLATARGDSLGLFLAAESIVAALDGDVSLSDILTPAGIALLGLLDEIQGCKSVVDTAVAEVLGADPTLALTRDDFIHSPYAHRFANLTAAGARPFAGPMLVLQGTEDKAIPAAITTKYVDETCRRFPDCGGIHYVKARGVGHVPVMYATQQVWLQWLGERFAEAGGGGKARDGAPAGCTAEELGADAPRPLGEYQSDLNYFLEYALDSYQVA